MWFGTSNSGMAKFQGGVWSVYNTSNSDLPFDQISDIRFRSDGIMWVNSKGNGLVEFNGDTWTTYDDSNSGLPSTQIEDIEIAPDGDLWIGISSDEFIRYDGSTWKLYNTSNSGSKVDRIFTLEAAPDGSLWIGGFRNPMFTQVSVYAGGLDYLLEENSQWLDASLWRTTYDITTFVPRGVYTLTISSAKGTDGIAIAADSRFNFTVDYAGEISDFTPPDPPLVVAGGKTGDPSTVVLNWTAEEPDLRSSGTVMRSARARGGRISYIGQIPPAHL